MCKKVFKIYRNNMKLGWVEQSKLDVAQGNPNINWVGFTGLPNYLNSQASLKNKNKNVRR
jgi:hypothetical protein